MAKHNIMRAFRLDEISAVDSPAQKGAKAAIVKRDATVTVTKIATRDDLEKAIREFSKAKDPVAAKNQIIDAARALDATAFLPAEWRVGNAIGGDLIAEVTRMAPRALPDILDGVAKVEQIWDQVEKIDDKKVRKTTLEKLAVAKSAVVAAAWSTVDTASVADAESLLRKNFADYTNHALGLVSGVALGTSKGDETMFKGIAKSLGLAENATEADITAALAKREARIAGIEAVLKMDPAQRQFYDKADEAGKSAFVALDDAGRNDAIKAKGGKSQKEMDDDAAAEKAKGGTDCIKVDGQTIYKRDFKGDEVSWSIMKSQQARIEKAEEDAAIGVIAKRVTPLKHIIGKADDNAAILFRVAKGKSTQADADAVEAILKSANEVMSKSGVITKELGAGGGTGDFAKAADSINAQAQALVAKGEKGPNGKLIGIEKARTMVREQNPDLAKQEEDERRDAKRAA